MKTFEELKLQFEKLPIIASAFERLSRELPSTLCYHTPGHSLDVFNETLLFASIDKLPERQIELLVIGAAYHDLGFIIRNTQNERLGAEMAAEAMRDSKNYTEEEIRTVMQMIEDTQLRMVEGGFAQFPTQEISKYLLDADLSNLGRDDFFEKAELVRKEVGAPKSVETLEKVLQLIQCHQFYSPAARSLRQERKQDNIKRLIEKIKEWDKNK